MPSHEPLQVEYWSWWKVVRFHQLTSCIPGLDEPIDLTHKLSRMRQISIFAILASVHVAIWVQWIKRFDRESLERNDVSILRFMLFILNHHRITTHVLKRGKALWNVARKFSDDAHDERLSLNANSVLTMTRRKVLISPHSNNDQLVTPPEFNK